MKNRRHLPIALIAVLTTACIKEIQQPTNKYYVLGPWKINQILLNDKVDEATNVSAYRIRFNADSTYNRITLSGKIESGRWTYAAADTKLVLTKPGTPIPESYLILKLEKDEMNLQLLRESDKTGDVYVELRHRKD